LPAIGGHLQHRLHLFLLIERRRGVRASVRVNPDHVHGCLLVVVMCHGGQT